MKASFLVLLGRLGFWFFMLLACVFFSAVFEPAKFAFMFPDMDFPLWAWRVGYALVAVFCLCLMIKSNTVSRLGKKFHALERTIDLSAADFSFEKMDSGVVIRIGGSNPQAIEVGKSVLYLRSFGDDIDKNVEEGAETETYEETLATVLRDLGQLVCIGHPGEPLPQPGALRLYYRRHDEGWKNIVLGLLPCAELVVLRAGKTEGLAWEMQQIRAFLPPERFVCVILGKLEDRLLALKKVEKTLGLDIDSPDEFFDPEQRARFEKARHDARFNLGYVVLFDRDWQPSVEPIPMLMSDWKYYFNDTTKADNKFRLALRPIFQRLGIPWRLPIDWVSVAGAVVLAAVAVLLLFVFLF